MYFLGSLIVASADDEPGPEEGAPLRLESKVFKGRPAGGQERRYHSDRMLAYWEVSPVSEASLLCQCWSSDSALLPCYVLMWRLMCRAVCQYRYPWHRKLLP